LVYFAVVGGLVKIGTTTNLETRMRHLGIRLEAVSLLLDGGHSAESEMHLSFADVRVPRTEWFHLRGALADFIRNPSADGSLVDRAEAIVEEMRFASASMLKRRMKISWRRAADLMDKLEERGIVGHLEARGSTRAYLYPWQRTTEGTTE
jgi:DNA segregation ATPase FtsK/SpoIIIE-like protein